MESMDGGTSTPYSNFLGMKTQPRWPSSAVLGVLFATGAAVIFSTAGVIVRRVDLPAWDVSFWRSAFLVVSLLPLLLWQWRSRRWGWRSAWPDRCRRAHSPAWRWPASSCSP